MRAQQTNTSNLMHLTIHTPSGAPESSADPLTIITNVQQNNVARNNKSSKVPASLTVYSSTALSFPFP